MRPAQTETDSQGDKYYFYDAFKSKAENERLKAEQLQVYHQHQEAASVRSAVRRRKNKLRMRSRYLVALVPILPYVAHYFFKQQKNMLAAGSLLIMLTGALYFMWDFYFKPYNSTVQPE